MKLNAYVSASCALLVGFFLSSPATAQKSHQQPKGFHLFQKHRTHHPFLRGRASVMRPKTQYRQRPTGAADRLMSYVIQKNDGVKFQPSDSFDLAWRGSDNNPDIAMEIAETRLPYPDYLGNRLRPIDGYANIDDIGFGLPDSLQVSYSWGGSSYSKNDRTLITLDNQGRVVARTDQSYIGNTWKDDWKYIYQYDGQGRLSSEIYQSNSCLSFKSTP